jgi:hypothetical protein
MRFAETQILPSKTTSDRISELEEQLTQKDIEISCMNILAKRATYDERYE